MNNLSRLTLTSLSVSAALFGAASVQAASYIPIVEKSIYVTKTNMTCSLHENNDYDIQKDYCAAGASIDVRVNMSQMRSIISTGTQDKKIVRFSVTEEGGGTGIHLVDNMTQDHSWKQSNANRKTRIGPYVSKYYMSIKPTSGVTPNKVKDFPPNKNTNYQNRDTEGYDIGINGSAGASVDSTGPKAEGSIGAAFTYSQSKTLVYDTQDFSIVNRSSGSDFDLSFEFGIDYCDLVSQGTGCGFTDPHWSNAWVFDKSKFNPIAYANFKPNFDVIYETSPSETGSSSFDIEFGFEPRVRFGRVFPNVLFSHYDPDGSSYNTSKNTSVLISVDWNHPLFQPEAHVVLQSLNHNNRCLDAIGGNIATYSCYKDWYQTFGLDTEGRYKSRTGNNDKCLTAKSNQTLALESCGNSLAQQWYWSGNKLYSRYTDGSSTKYVLALDSNDNPIMQVDSQATKSDWQPKLKQVVL
jgi:hemolysin